MTVPKLRALLLPAGGGLPRRVDVEHDWAAIYGAALVVSEVDTFEGRDVASLTFAHARQVLDIVAPLEEQP